MVGCGECVSGLAHGFCAAGGARCMTTSSPHPVFDHLLRLTRPSRHVRARLASPSRGPSTATAPTTWPGCSSSPPESPTPTEHGERSRRGRGAVPERRADVRGRAAATEWTAPDVGSTSRQPRTTGAGASGGSERPPRTVMSAWFGRLADHPVRARRTGSGRHGRGRWPSRRWVLPNSSPSSPSTTRRASSSPTMSPRSPRRTADPAWPWPEPRLTYANAVLAEAMIAAGVSA